MLDAGYVASVTSVLGNAPYGTDTWEPALEVMTILYTPLRYLEHRYRLLR